MLSHRRGRSLSEALTLEQSEEGGLVISSINEASADQGLKEGDEVLGATINFDKLSKEDVLKVLKLMEPFNDKVQVLTKNNLSKSLENLDVRSAKNPETMLQDSYSKLYNTKIKKFIKGDLVDAEEDSKNSSGTTKPTTQGSSRGDPKQATGLPRLGVDFGLKSQNSKRINADLEADDLGLTAATDGSNLNLPPLGSGWGGAQVPKVKGKGLQIKTADFHQSGNLPEGQNVAFGGEKIPNADSPSLDVRMPKLERPYTAIESSGEMGTVGTPDVSFGKLSHSKKLKKPDLNLDDPVSFVQSPNLRLSGQSTDLDLEMPGINGSQFDSDGPHMDMPSAKVKRTPKKPKIDVNSPDMDMNVSSGKLNMPNFGFSGKSEADVRTPKSPGINNPKGFQAPKFKMPKFDLPDRSFTGDVHGSNNLDLEVPSPRLNINENGPLATVDIDAGMKTPELSDININAPSGKMKMPKLKGPNLDMNTDLSSPDFNVKTPKMKGGFDTPDVDLPNMDLKAPKLNVNTPDLNVGSSKGKLKMPKMKMPKFSFPGLKGPEIDEKLDLPDADVKTPNVNLRGPKADLEMPDFDVSGPSGKIKKPNLNLPNLGLSGPKLDGPNLDLETPDLDLSGPGLSGGMNAPDINMPKLDLKSPKMDLNAPKVNLDMPSGKLKMPELHAPDWDINAPSGKMKMPKLKGPNLDMPKVKGPQVDGNFHGPDIDINSPLKGGKTDFKSPNGDFSSPSGKIKKPHLKIPDVGFSAPKLDGPALEVKSRDPKAKLPKGPNLNIHSNLQSPDLNFKTPKIKGPNVDINRDLHEPYLNITHLDVDGPKGKLTMPSLTTPDVSLSGPKVKPVGLNISGPKVKGPGRPDLNIDDPALSSKRPSGKNHRSDMTDLSMKVPNLNTDGEVRLRHPDMKSARAKARSSFPMVDTDLRQHIDFNHPDLNIDDFTEKDHVLLARGSPHLQVSRDHEQAISSSGVNINRGDPRHKRHISTEASLKQPVAKARLPQSSEDLSVRVPDSSDGYYVTVFPTQAQNQKTPNRKYNTLGGLEFNSKHLDLEVPDEKDLKGSTFFFSNLV